MEAYAALRSHSSLAKLHLLLGISRLPESLLLGNNQDPPRLMWVKAGTQHESAFHLHPSWGLVCN